MDCIELPPRSNLLVESLRDIGYSIETAIADIIDNSLTAKAGRIDIDFSWNCGSPWIAIIDDGLGMNKTELISAMRIGSMSPKEQRSKTDLGRFGLGMKTASFSQCRSLSVLSKKKNEEVCCAQWDLDYISSINDTSWSLLLIQEEDLNTLKALNCLKTKILDKYSSGTIVLWEKIDRIIEKSEIKSQEIIFNETMNLVRTHLELVFHRFISPDSVKLKTQFFHNNSPLVAFDPFNTSKSTELREEQFFIEGERISVQPYVLPHHNKVSKTEWAKYSGKQGYLQEQGFYVYRNKRLIIKSNWFRLLQKTELTKLLRVRIDIPNSLDHLWKIDVKKANAFPPAAVRDNLKIIIDKIEISGKSVYRQRGQKLHEKIITPIWERIAKNNSIQYTINKEHPLIKALLLQSQENHDDKFISIINILENTFPKESLFHDVASSPEKVQNSSFNEENLIKCLDLFLGDNKEMPTYRKLSEIIGIDPFASNKGLTEKIFKDRNYEYRVN